MAGGLGAVPRPQEVVGDAAVLAWRGVGVSCCGGCSPSLGTVLGSACPPPLPLPPTSPVTTLLVHAGEGGKDF